MLIENLADFIDQGSLRYLRLGFALLLQIFFAIFFELRKLRAEDRLVFLCLHPNEPWHLEILREVCERFVFVERGRLMHAGSLAELERDPRVRAYLGRLAGPGSA